MITRTRTVGKAGLLAGALAATALLAPGPTAQAASGATGPNSVQQRGLAALQREIDATIAISGGRRTGLNEITSPDGKAVLELPMPAGTESLARPATTTSSTAAAKTTGYRYGCPYSTTSAGGRWLCLYQYGDYNGNSLGSTGPGSGRLLRFQDAGYQALWPYDFQNRTSSVVNTTYFTWTVYDWFKGDPNCGAGDTPSEAVFTVAKAASGSYTRKNLVGTIYNDNSDCIFR